MVTFLFLEYYFLRNEKFYVLGRFIATFILLSLHDQIITQAVHLLNARSTFYRSKLSSSVDSVNNDRNIVFFDIEQNCLESKKMQQLQMQALRKLRSIRFQSSLERCNGNWLTHRLVSRLVRKRNRISRGNEDAVYCACTVIGHVRPRNVEFLLRSRQPVGWWSRCRGHGSEVRCGSSAHIHIKWLAFMRAAGHWNALKTSGYRGSIAAKISATILLRRMFHSWTLCVLDIYRIRSVYMKCCFCKWNIVRDSIEFFSDSILFKIYSINSLVYILHYKFWIY